MQEEDSGGTMAQKVQSRCLLSLDFELKNDNLNRSYASSVGALLMEKFGLDAKEINGVYRSGLNAKKQAGFMKIRMNGPIDVNKRFGHYGGVAEDDTVKITIRGIKKQDEVLVRVVNPPELLDNRAIFSEISKLGTPVIKYLYDEKFAAGIPLFGGKSNGNLRTKIVLNDPKDAMLNLIHVGKHKVRIQIIGKKTCHSCGSSDHMKLQCPDQNVVGQEKSSTDGVSLLEENVTNKGVALSEKSNNVTEDPWPSAVTHITEDTQGSAEQKNPMVEVGGQMVPIGVAGSVIPNHNNASESNPVCPSAEDGTEKDRSAYANAVKRPLSFSPEAGAKKMHMGVVSARKEHK